MHEDLAFGRVWRESERGEPRLKSERGVGDDEEEEEGGQWTRADGGDDGRRRDDDDGSSAGEQRVKIFMQIVDRIGV